MAESRDRISGQDIFDGNLAGAYSKFVTLNKEAAQAIEKLKQEIIELNNALKGSKGTSANFAKVNRATTTYAKATTKAAAATNKLTKSQRGLAKSQKSVQSGFSKIGGSLKSLLGAAGFAGLAFTLVQVAKSIYETGKALESINLALTKVTSSTYEFARSQEFLLKISDRLGINLIKTSKRYATFLAAAKQSNLTLGETNEIFETFADVGANLALTSDEMSSIFLALEQMLSKGKVSTEELRRQLGEKLPGAMGIMAEALGVTTGELDKMLRKGLVLSETALPLFAKQVEKTFSVDKTKKVLTMAAAQERLTNSWIAFVKVINTEGTGLNKALKETLDILTDFVSELEYMASAEFTESQKGFWSTITSGISGFFGAIYDFVNGGYDEAFEKWKLDKKDAENLASANREFKELARVVGEVQKLFGDDRGGLEYLRILGLTDENGNLVESAESIRVAVDFFTEMLNDIKNGVKKRQKEGKSTGIIGAVLGIDDLGSLEKEALEKYHKLLLALEEEQRKEIENLKQRLLADPDNTWLNWSLGITEDQLKKTQKLLGAIYSTGLVKNVPGFTETVDPNGPTSATTSSGGVSEFGEAFSKENLEKLIGYAGDFYDEIAEIENNAFERRMMQLDEEENAINRKYETAFRLAGDDKDLQDKLRIRQEEDIAKLEKKRKKLEYEQAKAKKKQDIIKAIINTAVGVTAQFQAGPGGIVLGAIVAALGAIQIAAIASQPLPAYAKGTDNHKGGLALLGDGGKSELAITPSGGVYMSGDKPEVVDMPKGSRVIADAQEYINSQIVRSILDVERRAIDEMVVDKISQEIRKGFKGVNMNNNVTLNNSIDFQSYRHTLLN